MAKKKAAKKRGHSRKTREVAPEHELPGGFWRQVVAVLMIALAVFLVLTWFGSGGEALNKVDEIHPTWKLSEYHIVLEEKPQKVQKK